MKRRISEWLSKSLAFLLIWAAVPISPRSDNPVRSRSEAQDQRGQTRGFTDEVTIGELVGAEYDSRRSDFVLYATEAEPRKATALYIDDVIKMTDSVLSVGDFAFSLEPEGKHMQIRYLPLEIEKELKPILHESTTEYTLFYADKVLKKLKQGEKVASGLRLGASELFLCAREFEASDNKQEFDPARTYLTYFEVEADYRFYKAGGVGVFFENARVVVKAATREKDATPRKCAEEFANNLTNGMDQLLANEEIGKEFRRLKALLLLNKTIGWASSIFVPFNHSQIKTYSTRAMKTEPIPIKANPVVGANSGDRRKLSGYVASGGIRLSTGHRSAFPAKTNLRSLNATVGAEPEALPLKQHSDKPFGGRRPPGFLVDQVVKDGRSLLRINISATLGL